MTQISAHVVVSFDTLAAFVSLSAVKVNLSQVKSGSVLNTQLTRKSCHCSTHKEGIDLFFMVRFARTFFLS